jgi:hypothetical protein
MSNIYNCWKYFLEKYIYPLFDVRVYPFDLMDYMYFSDSDFESDVSSILPEKEDKKRRILEKMCDFDSLEKDEYDFLATLSNYEFIQFMRIYDANLEFIPEYIDHKM